MKKAVLSLFLGLSIFAVWSPPSFAQVLFSAGAYSQSFDSLANSGTNNIWADNSTLSGWYVSKTAGGTTIPVYRGDNGSSSAGALYSFGSTSASDRALGSISSGTPGNFAYGVRFLNDSASAQTNITISYTGEQWRNSGETNAQKLTFSYRVGTSLTNSDASNSQSWTAFPALDFSTPTVVGSTGPLDGNNATNRLTLSPTILTNVVVLPGQELFLRWFDTNDVGNDHALAIDNLTVTTAGTIVDVRPASITTPPESQAVIEGTDVAFSVVADGAATLTYQWAFNGTNIANATLSTLSLPSTSTTNSGTYTVTVGNAYGSTNASATLIVSAQPASTAYGLSLMTYNVKGNGATDWTTNAAQVQAIGRQVKYLQPDVITFNEIPYTLTYEMTNFLKAYLPGYYMATNSGTDNFIRSVIVSRYPITRSSKWLDGADLNPFGYTNANFTRDLFEAQINVPSFQRPLHVFVTHLKSSAGGYADAVAKRAAEAAAITNFFATNFFVLYPNDPYTLSGDMNESDTNSIAIQELVSPFSGLRLTNPTNPYTGTINTYSIQASVSERIDYIMPCTLLASNIVSSQVFRTDLVSPTPPNIITNDDKIASDHLPVLMYFRNPYDVPFQFSSVKLTNQLVTLNWQSITGRQYRVDISADLTNWFPLKTNVAAVTNLSFSTNVGAGQQFFRVYRVP